MACLTQFEFMFKGGRDYVHGTDIYKAFVGYYSATSAATPKALQISFHGMARKNLELVSGCDEKSIKVLLTVTKGDMSKEKYYLREAQSSPAGRYPYDEDSVVDGWILGDDGLSAHLKRPKTEYTVIESLVALNKAFLTKLHSPDGKWLFARLKINGLLPERCELIHLSTNSSSNLRLVRSKIEIDGQAFGEIYFSLT